MSEAGVLVLVSRYPHPAAVARRAGGAVFAALGRLEGDGLVTRRRGLYRLTKRGKSELGLQLALIRTLDV